MSLNKQIKSTNSKRVLSYINNWLSKNFKVIFSPSIAKLVAQLMADTVVCNYCLLFCYLLLPLLSGTHKTTSLLKDLTSI